MDKEYFLKRLTIANPSRLQTCNYEHLPATFLATDKIPIECLRHGIFHQRAYSHLFSSGCSKCGREKTLRTITNTKQEFINRSVSRFGDRFNYDKTNYVKQDCELIITCKVHGDLTLTPHAHFWSTYGCAKCDYEIPRAKRFKVALERAKEVHGDKYDYSKINYSNSSDKVEIVCPKHGSFWQSLFSHCKIGNECPKCAKDKEKVPLKEFLARAYKLHGEKDSYDKVAYNALNDHVTITCKTHGDYTQRAGSHLAGYRCRKCHVDQYILSTEQFIENARKVHGDKYDYSKVVYRGNKKPVEIICPTHGSFFLKPNGHVSTRQGCGLCQESKGEIAVEVFLKKYRLEYVRQYRVQPYLFRYDFYLPEFDIYIEFHGKQHYMPVDLFGGQLGFEKTKERDERKRDIVKEVGGTLIELSYLCLKDGSVEKELIARLKKAYVKWYVIDGKIKAFKTHQDVYNTFNIPEEVLVRFIDQEVMTRVNNFDFLFKSTL